MKTPEYPTKDLQLSAFLRTKGHQLLRVERDRHPRLLVFAHTPQLDTDVGAYFAGSPVSAQLLFDSYRSLKRAMFDLA